MASRSAASRARALLFRQAVLVDHGDDDVDVPDDVPEGTPVARARVGDVGHVDGSVVVLLADLADLHLGDERVGRRDRLGVDVHAAAHVDGVIHAYDVHEYGDLVHERRGRGAAKAPSTHDFALER